MNPTGTASPPISMLTALINELSHLTPLHHASSSSSTAQPHNTALLVPASPPAPHHQGRSPLINLSASDTSHARSIFLTLHLLFPHELLPALDLLDRCLVTRLVVSTEQDVDVDTTATSTPPSPRHNQEAKNDMEAFYVQSASAVSSTNSARSRYRPAPTSATYYEVRLDSWNCSCPAFSVSSFQALNITTASPSSSPSSRTHEASAPEPTTTSWAFGGISNSAGKVPSCKHILAAVLAKAAPALFAEGFETRVVSRAEMVAWGAGWGEFG